MSDNQNNGLRGGVRCDCGQVWEVIIRKYDDVTNERKNITQPPDWWAAFESAAKAEGMTLAEWIGEAAKAKLPKSAAKKLSERPPANRPKKASD